MFRNILGFINDKYKSVYYQYRTNNKFTISNYFILLIKSLVDLIFFIFQKFPGPLGIYLRQKFYKLFIKKVGKNLIIRENVKISDLSKLSIGDNVLISDNVCIYNDLSEYYIGSNSHIGPGVIFGGRNNIIVGNNVGISSGCHIYSGAVKLKNTKKKLWFPSMPENERDGVYGNVKIGDNACIMPNSTITPGRQIEEGGVLIGNSFLTKNVNDYEIWSGSPAKKIGHRKYIRN